MKSELFAKKNNFDNTGLSDAILTCSVILLVVAVLFSFLFPETMVAASLSYILVTYELIVSAYLIYSNRGLLLIDYEGIVAIVYIITCFYFTTIHAGLVNSVTAVFKEYIIIFVCVFLKCRTYSFKGFKRNLNIVILFACLALIVSVINDNMINTVIHITNVYEADIHSIYSNKNQFGRLLYLAAVCSFFMYIISSRKVNRRFYFLITGIFSLATVITFSRTSLLALGVFFAFYYLFNLKGNLFKHFILIVSIVIVVFIILSNDALYDYIITFIVRKEVGIDERSGIWMAGINYISKHPLVGAGEYMAENIIHAAGMHIDEFHNEYIYRMVASGIPVALLYLGIIIERFITIINNRKNNPVMNCSIAMLISLLAYMFFEQYSIFQFSATGIVVIMFLYIAPNIKEFNKENYLNDKQ